MFAHARIKKLISAYLDGEVSDKEKIRVEEHLRSCAKCKKYWQELQATSIGMKEWRDEEISPDLEQEIRSRFLWQKTKGGTMKKTKLFAGAASVALVTLLVFMLAGSMESYKRNTQGKLAAVGDQIGDGYYPILHTVEKKMRGHSNRSMNSARTARFASTGSTLHLFSPPHLTSNEYAHNEAAGEYGASVYKAAVGVYAYEDGGPIITVQPYLPATGTEEKLIRTADLGLEVNDVQTAYDKIVAISKDNKGFLAQANFSELGRGKISARLSVRIPKDKFETTLDEIRKLGRVKTFNIDSVDVSSDYAKLVTELNTQKIVYDKILEKLKEKKTDIDKAIRLESELSPVTKQIEAIKAQISKYDNLIAMPTITVEVFSTNWQLLMQQNIKTAKERLVNIFADLINAAIDLLPAAVCIILLLLTALLVVSGITIIIKLVFRKKSS
ncbi:MAG: DUF4349 domain-containing protein [Candidatus Omnitrophica bacterium]|nr:DUF4349 domain-containing protein [Candidatus Omnitrophota bacterium]